MAKKRLNMTTLPPVAYIPTPDGIPSHRPLVAGEKIGGEYIQISEQEGNQVQLGNDGGIFVPTSGGGGTTTSLVTANSVSINLSGTGVDGDPLEAELQTGAWTNGNPLTNLVVGVGGAKTNGVFVAGVRRYMTRAITVPWVANGLAATISNIAIPAFELQGASTRNFNVKALVTIYVTDTATKFTTFPDPTKGIRVVFGPAPSAIATTKGTPVEATVLTNTDNTGTISGYPRIPTYLAHPRTTDAGTYTFNAANVVSNSNVMWGPMVTTSQPLYIYTDNSFNNTGKAIASMNIRFVVDTVETVNMPIPTSA